MRCRPTKRATFVETSKRARSIASGITDSDDSIEARLRQWYAQTHKTSIVDPTFDEYSLTEHLAAYYHHLGTARDTLLEQVKSAPPTVRELVRQRLEQVERALGLDAAQILRDEMHRLQEELAAARR